MTDKEKMMAHQKLLGVDDDGIPGVKTQAAWDALVNRLLIPPPQPGPAPAPGQFDARTEKNLATLAPKAIEKFRPFIAAAKAIAAKEGLDYIITDGSRTWAEQDEIYKQGRSKPGPIVTKARGGQSLHNFGIAADFGVFRNGKWLDDAEPKTASRIHKAVGAIAAHYGLEWGGNFTSIYDEPHFQVKTGLTLAQMQARHKSGVPII